MFTMSADAAPRRRARRPLRHHRRRRRGAGRSAGSPVPGPLAATPRDEHEARVLALRTALAHTCRSRLATDNLATAPTPPRWPPGRVEPCAGADDRAAGPAPARGRQLGGGRRRARRRRSRALPRGHAVRPLLRRLRAAPARLGRCWSPCSCSRALLVAGAVGNIAVIGLWAITRTLGLPFGLLPEPEAVGPWDVACGGWELIVACSCIALLQSRDPLPDPRSSSGAAGTRPCTGSSRLGAHPRRALLQRSAAHDPRPPSTEKD